MIDHVPPSPLNNGKVWFTILVGNGNLEFHISHAHILDIRVGISEGVPLLQRI